MLVNLTLPTAMRPWEFVAVLVTGVLLVAALVTGNPDWITAVAATLAGTTVTGALTRPGRRGRGARRRSRPTG